MPNHKEQYGADSIRVLEGLEAVRTRPGMYIGSVSTRGLNHLIYEIVDNSVDEHLAGYCDTISVTLEADGSCTVSDNGRGIPIGMHEKGISAERAESRAMLMCNGAVDTSTRPGHRRECDILRDDEISDLKWVQIFFHKQNHNTKTTGCLAMPQVPMILRIFNENKEKTH